MITTSRSAVATYQSCPRKRYWGYEAENGTPTRGWERRKLNIPLSTGIYTHAGLRKGFETGDWTAAAQFAKDQYLEAVTERGLAVDGEGEESDVIDEQVHHAMALVLGFGRVRAPKILAEHEIIELEVENPIPLSDDVTLATRCDMTTIRRYDHRKFVWNFKTVATVDERWLKSFEVNMQNMTELLAAERRHGHEFGGVIIEGLIKGPRVKEKDNVGTVTGRRDATPLLYGYKLDSNPPLNAGEYGWEYTRRKGWYRFPVWKEKFPLVNNEAALWYWINWLPLEVVEAQFCVVPPIMRDAERIQHKVAQIVAMEQKIAHGIDAVRVYADKGDNIGDELDYHFPQNEQECHWPSKCPMYDLCYTHGVADDPGGSGLYQPRIDHHKEPSND